MTPQIAGWVVALALLGAAAPKKAEPLTLSGTVIELTDALHPTGLTFDAEPIARQYVQVVSFQVKDHGRLRTPEYFCEICTISVRIPQTCLCCQGPMELRMKPEGR